MPGTLAHRHRVTGVRPRGEFDAHGMEPVAVLASLGALGGSLPPRYVVGCRPETLEEGIGLCARVKAAVPTAVDTVTSLVHRLVAERSVEIGRS